MVHGEWGREGPFTRGLGVQDRAIGVCQHWTESLEKVEGDQGFKKIRSVLG